MEIVFHARHAVISAELRERAERAVHKAAARLPRAVDATVRFEEDGPARRRVEIVLHASRQRPVVAAAEARLFGAALTEAAARLHAQVAKSEPPRARGRRAGGASPGGTASRGADDGADVGAGDDAEFA